MMQLPLEDQHDGKVLKRKLWLYIKTNADIFAQNATVCFFTKKGNKG